MDHDPLIDRLRSSDPAAGMTGPDPDAGWGRVDGAVRQRVQRRRAAFGGVGAFAVAAAVTVFSFSGGDGRAPELLRLAPGSGGRVVEEATASASADGATVMADSLAVAPWGVEYRFTGVEDLALPDGKHPGWRLVADDPRQAAAALAERLGVAGEPVDDYGTWSVGAWPGPSVSVGTDGNWWYSAGDACSEAIAVEPFPGDDIPRVEPEVVPADGCDPLDVRGVYPTEDALERARTVWGALPDGVELGSVHTDASLRATWVSATLTVDGTPSDLSLHTSFAANGNLQWASGYAGRFASLGDYPLVVLDTALAALSSGHDAGVAYGEPMAGEPEPALPPEAPDESGAAGRTNAHDVGEPMPCAPVDPRVPAELEVVEVRLTAARLNLAVRWDADGALLLLPAFTFDSEGGATWSTLAIPAEYLAQPESDAAAGDTPVSGGAAEGATENPEHPDTAAEEALPPVACLPPLDGVGGEVGPVAGGGAEALPPAADLPGTTVTGTTVAEEVAAAAIGAPLEQVVAMAEQAGLSVRVTARDGEYFAGTADWRDDRVNVEVVDGTVTAASVG